MDNSRTEEKVFNLADLPAFPPTDETGDVDMTLIDYNLSLTVAERIRQHGQALKLVQRLEDVRRQWYGFDDSSPEKTPR